MYKKNYRIKGLSFLWVMLLWITMFLPVASLMAQDGEKKTAVAQPLDTLSILQMINEGSRLTDKKPDEALQYFITALERSRQQNYAKGIALANAKMARWYFGNNSDKSIDCSRQALQYFEKDAAAATEDKAAVHLLLAEAFDEQGRQDSSAYYYYLLGSEIESGNISNPQLAVDLYTKLAIFWINLDYGSNENDEYFQTLKRFVDKAKAAATSIKDSADAVVSVYFLQGAYYHALKKFDSARHYYNVYLVEREQQNKLVLARKISTLTNIADTYLQENKPGEAMKYIGKVEQLGNGLQKSKYLVFYMLFTNLLKGKALYQQKQYLPSVNLISETLEKLKATGSNSLQYDYSIRMEMNNSLRLLPAETQALIDTGTHYVIRIKINPNEFVHFTDMIRGDIEIDTNNVDDKVLLKADGMPTYHLAVVVDDYLMQISHAFRGEEWMPSAAVHILLWKYLFGLDAMPQWAHLPLILKPDGNGKLSKRDGDRLGFPVYAMDWQDPISKEITKGFKELGFLPEAFINLLAVLGWNDGTEQELFSLEELIEKFSMERVHKGGAKFDFEKAKWFNHEWIKKLPAASLRLNVKQQLEAAAFEITDTILLDKVIELVKERCTLLTDFVQQAGFFFKDPSSIDIAAIKPKWDDKKQLFFIELLKAYQINSNWDMLDLENGFKEIAAASQLKPGELMLPFRIMLVGGKFGPGVFDIAETIGKEATLNRIEHTLSLLQ